ncbi:MAG: T9SS type A sorting domain-containing protein [Flavobacteriales bacterium]|nr:T9SS type A sorting domain-containing protein [Flavobacteriales bacterium]MDG1766301.1 T9SS type A sorting domain-containing protein [Flavobacteriales bacterium]
MKRFLLFIACAVLSTASFAQFTGLEVEVYQVHDGSLPALEGMTTYRLYANFADPDDFVSAMSGLQGEPLKIRTSTSFYQSPAGGDAGFQINPAIFAFVPEAEFDSFMTIGVDDSNDPGQNITIIDDTQESWLAPFNAGEDLIIDGLVGGAWFVTFGATTVNAFAGPEGRVLLGQFTTDGTFDGVMNIQVFENASQDNDFRVVGEPFSSDPTAIFGCTDETALNFDPSATVDDCTCEFPCFLNIDEVVITPTTCANTSNGSAQIVTSGGQGSVFFNLNDGNNLVINTYNNLGAGTYDILVFDSQGCRDSLMFDMIVPEPIGINVSLDSPISCNGDANGVLVAQSTGGTGAFTYSLDAGFTSPTTDPTFSNLGPGNYVVYAQDENGCAAQTTPLNLSQPLVLQANSTNVLAASCFGAEDGRIIAIGIGGTPPYQYSVDGESWQNSNLLDLPAGDYVVNILDANGCFDLGPNTLTIGQPDEIVISEILSNITCNGDGNGSIEVAATGGNGGFSFSFDGGDFSDVVAWDMLAAGVYTVDVVDSDDCVAQAEFEIIEPVALSVVLNESDITCNGAADGAVLVEIEGGTPDYTVDGDTVGLEAGEYTYTVTDANGCVATETATIEEPTALEVSVDEVVNAEDMDGSIDVTATGGTGVLTYSWTGPNGFTSDQEDLTGLDVGEYELTVTDENGCEVATEAVSVLVGIGELLNRVSLSVYPNPNNGMFTLNIEGLNGEAVNFDVVDAIGKTVASEQFNSVNASFQHQMDLSNLANGLYYLNIQLNGSVKSIKMVKQ